MDRILDAYTKKFKKLFDPLCKGRDSTLAFSSFMEIAALTLHQAPYHDFLLPKDEVFEGFEAQYVTAIRDFNRAELDCIAALIGLSRAAIRFLKMDFLGHVYMTLGIGGNQRGQFFTPARVQKLLARLTLRPLAGLLAEKKIITMHEPAIGSGGVVIEAANEFENQGFDPRKAMWFLGIDIDRRCFNMAYFQLGCLELRGEVMHGNALSLEIWDSRSTPAEMVFQSYSSRLAYHESANSSEATITTGFTPDKMAQIAFDFTMPSPIV